MQAINFAVAQKAFLHGRNSLIATARIPDA